MPLYVNVAYTVVILSIHLCVTPICRIKIAEHIKLLSPYHRSCFTSKRIFKQYSNVLTVNMGFKYQWGMKNLQFSISMLLFLGNDTAYGYTRCVIITGTPNFQGQNLVNAWFICTKISWPRHEIMLREVLPELSTI